MPASNVPWPVPLQRLTPWYPGQFGVRGTDSDRGLREDSAGCIFWVDPNHVDANDQKDGTNPDSPFATITAALTHCRAYSGDVIAVASNSNWTYGDRSVGRATAITEAVTITTPGVRLVGLALSGSLGVPWIPIADNQVCITVHAMDVLIEGFSFWRDGSETGTVGIKADWNGPTYYGENCTIRHCYFYDLAYGIQLDYAWNCHIEDCRFDSINTAAIHNPSVYGEPDYNTFLRNQFVDCTAAINLPACDYEIIHANHILGDGGGTNNFINLTGGANNWVSDNWLSCTIAEYDTTCSDGTSGSWGGNHCENGDTTAAPT